MKEKYFKFKFILMLLWFLQMGLGGIVAQDYKKLFKTSAPAIVKISATNKLGLQSNGTGFFINENTILTCYHLLGDVKTIKITTLDGANLTIDKIITANRKVDMVLFSVKEKSKAVIRLAETISEPGENICVIGHPDGYDYSIASGIVSGIRSPDSIVMIQVSAPCSQGNSGGPVLNEKGEAIGVMSFVKFIGQNLNFAVSVTAIKNMQDDNTLKNIVAGTVTFSKSQIDSIFASAKENFGIREFEKALYSASLIAGVVDSGKAVDVTELMANCHFLLKNYVIAAQYYEMIIKMIVLSKDSSHENYFRYADAMYKYSFCNYMLGNTDGAISMGEQSANVCKAGLVQDTLLKELYTLILQQIYSSAAIYYLSQEKKFEACLNWALARQYGIKQEDSVFEQLCK